MSQERIQELLSGEKTRWWTVDDIRNQLQITKGSVSHNLKMMREYGDVKFKPARSAHNKPTFLYKYKREEKYDVDKNREEL